jgi:NADH:ubiquinone oxidoreductase subunit 2 (subunit N)
MMMANPIYNLATVLEISEKSNGMHLFMDNDLIGSLRQVFSGNNMSNMLFFILNNSTHNYQELTWNVGNSLLSKDSNLMFWDLVSFLLIMGFVIKLGLAPFGLWLQDLYTSISIPVLTFFSTAPKITYITILVSLYMNLFIVVNPENFLNIKK